MPRSIPDQIALGEDSTRQFKADVTNGESLAAEMIPTAEQYLSALPTTAPRLAFLQRMFAGSTK